MAGMEALEFVEYDVEARSRSPGSACASCRRQRIVPVLVEDGKVVQVGWQGRSCIVNVG